MRSEELAHVVVDDGSSECMIRLTIEIARCGHLQIRFVDFNLIRTHRRDEWTLVSLAVDELLEIQGYPKRASSDRRQRSVPSPFSTACTT